MSATSTSSGTQLSTRGYCAALDKPYITLHGEDIVHPLKEVDAAAQAWWTTTDQAVEILRYVLKA